MAVRKNTELPLHMVISVNQLSLCGAEADMIEELPFVPRAPVKPAASGQLENMKFLHNLLSQKCKPIKSDKKTCCKNEQRFLKISEDHKLSRLRSEAGLRKVEVGQFFCALPSPRGRKQISLFADKNVASSKKLV